MTTETLSAAGILANIQTSFASGKTVYVGTCTRTTKITPRAWNSWQASGKPFMKLASDGDLMMIEGGRYVRLTTCGGNVLLVNIRVA